MKKLSDYKNFWLVWLNCANSKNGTTLYRVQQDWGIKTNYLYHKESGLAKPLFQAMIESEYLIKADKKVKADFSWISNHVIESNKIEKKGWSGSVLIIENWPVMQKFIETEREILFSKNNLMTLFRNNIHSLNKSAHNIFNDLFLLSIISNISSISKKHNAAVVERILNTSLSLFHDRDLLNYYLKLRLDVRFPTIIRDEEDMNTSLYPVIED